MKTFIVSKYFRPTFIVALLLFLLPTVLRSHCDSMNGPVVTAAKKALESGNVNLILIWVQQQYEPQIKQAFQNTLAVRKLSKEAQQLADMYFFETLVRLHRAGEGEAYTGLKSAETEIEPGIAAADEALSAGSSNQLITHLNESVHRNLKERFDEVISKKDFSKDNAGAGRDYVKAYVQFIHYVERLHLAITETHGAPHE